MKLKIKIVNENAKGLYKTDLSEKDDSGLDLYVLEDIDICVGETVFIDRGRADGVRVGNSFYVVSRQDEVVDTKGPDPSMPPSVIGRLVVVRVDDYSATAVITDASQSIPVGSEILTRMN